MPRDWFLRLMAPEDGKGAGSAEGAAGDEKQQQGAEGDKLAAAGGDEGKPSGKEAASGGDGVDKEAKGNLPDYSLTPEIKAFLLGGLSDEAKGKAEKWLGTRASIADLFKSAYSADGKIQELSQGRIKVPTGKNDDPKDVAAFRKALGIPDSADKYALWTPEGMAEMTAEDKELWGEALADFHAGNMGQRQVDIAVKAFHRAQATAAKAMEARVQAAAEKAQEDLRVEYGRDYKPNIELANRWLGENAPGLRGEDGKSILDKRFADGMALGEHPEFVKLVVRLAKAEADDGDILKGADGGGVDPDKRLDELMELMNTDRKKYQSAAVQQEIQRLTAMQMRRQQNGARA